MSVKFKKNECDIGYLEKLVGQPHEDVHPGVLLVVVGDLEQVEDHGVHSHVPQEPLLVLSGLAVGRIDAQLVHPENRRDTGHN